ncbi:hypothetical protein [Emticicia sp. C21]|uniref:hypothetical protein n=1 Tax=Emticicia sp. C21 TaxID=2302915 RepID=UPI000E34AFD1|nr:hypothetical protein [Emticicia sp. C21]RFS18534.1 hypothetical protein D0T08_04600 [Emticicia sp. C21]
MKEKKIKVRTGGRGITEYRNMISKPAVIGGRLVSVRKGYRYGGNLFERDSDVIQIPDIKVELEKVTDMEGTFLNETVMLSRYQVLK